MFKKTDLKGGLNMNCSVCGATYADGQPACPNCGAPAQPMGQPMGTPMGQPMGAPMGQPMGQPMGGMAPMGGAAPVNNQYVQGTGFKGFLEALKTDYMKIIALVGGLLVFISPFFSWCNLEIEFWGMSESESYSMWSLGREYSDVRWYYLWTILLLVIGLGLILWDAADYIPALSDIKTKIFVVPFVDLIAIGVGLLVVIFALSNGTVNDVIEEMKDYGDGSHGIGPVIAIIGLLAAAFPRVIKLIKK